MCGQSLQGLEYHIYPFFSNQMRNHEYYETIGHVVIFSNFGPLVWIGLEPFCIDKMVLSKQVAPAPLFPQILQDKVTNPTNFVVATKQNPFDPPFHRLEA